MLPDTKCFPSKTGWINGPLFLQWRKFFVRPAAENKALLILDSHESHHCVPILDFASVLLSVPLHCTNNL